MRSTNVWYLLTHLLTCSMSWKVIRDRETHRCDNKTRCIASWEGCTRGNIPQESKIGWAPKNESNRYRGTKRHLRPLDAFSGLRVCPKFICGRNSIPNLLGELTALPKPIAGGEGLAASSPRTAPLSLSDFGLEFRPFWPPGVSQRQIPCYACEYDVTCELSKWNSFSHCISLGWLWPDLPPHLSHYYRRKHGIHSYLHAYTDKPGYYTGDCQCQCGN